MHRFGKYTAECTLSATVEVVHPQFWADAAFGGTTGAGESYIHGHWRSDDLVALVRIMVLNRDIMENMEGGLAFLTAPLRRIFHWMNRNSKDGSRRNIAAHYDLGNDFFQLFLDDTMAYSCGIFEAPEATLKEASLAKFDAVCRKLQLQAQRSPGRNRHRLGRPRDPRREEVWLPRHDDDDLQGTIRAGQGARRRRRLERSHRPAPRRLSRPHRPVRQAGVDRDDRSRRPSVPRHLHRQVRLAAQAQRRDADPGHHHPGPDLRTTR